MRKHRVFFPPPTAHPLNPQDNISLGREGAAPFSSPPFYSHLCPALLSWTVLRLLVTGEEGEEEKFLNAVHLRAISPFDGREIFFRSLFFPLPPPGCFEIARGYSMIDPSSRPWLASRFPVRFTSPPFFAKAAPILFPP